MKPSIDLITLEVVLEYFVSTVREMGKTIMRTAHSSIIFEGQDFSCAILDKEGALVAQSEGSPAHIIPLPAQVREALLYFGGDLSEGDVVIVNDTYSSGTHMNDVAMMVPFFADGRRIAIAVVRAHWGDIGGMTPGSISGGATEIYQEGLRIPFVKIYRGGKRVEGLLELILANVRVPDEREGDFYAMLACCHTALDRMRSLAERFGTTLIEDLMVEHLNRSERRMRDAIARVRPGTYAYEDYFDGDAASGGPIPLRVSITVDGGTLKADFAGSASQTGTPVNCSLAVTAMGTFVALKALLDPRGHINQGAFRPVTVVAPEGTIVNAAHPAAMGGFSEVRRRVESVVMGALAMAAPDYVAGDIKGATNHTYIASVHPAHGRPTIFYEYPSGGTGGFREHDGSHTIRAYDEGDFTSIQPAEAVELEHALLVERCELRVDSCGDGLHRGGLGLHREIRLLAKEGNFSELSDRNILPPFGVCGGYASAPNAFAVLRDGVAISPSAIPGKVSKFPLLEGDIVVMETAGGGGYGSALARDPASVLEDVRQGYITAGRALDRYGVAIVSDSVDQTATQSRRSALKTAIATLRILEAPTDEYEGGRRTCRISNFDARKLDIAEGGLMELVNEQGAPLRAWVVVDDLTPRGSLLMGPIGRSILGAKAGVSLEVRILGGVLPR